MAEKEKDRWIDRLRRKFRVVAINNETFEEKWSYNLSTLNLVTIFSFIGMLLIITTFLLVVLTPLKEYIPGYLSGDIKEAAFENDQRVEKTQQEIRHYKTYTKNLATILNGGIVEDSSSINDKEGKPIDPNKIKIKPSLEDSLLRDKIESSEKFDIPISSNKTNINLRGIFFFNPLHGEVSRSFNSKEEHYGVDIVAPDNEAVKSILEGTVVFASWTSDEGHVIHVQHNNDLISIYKHNSVLLKKTGDVVEAGEPIGIVGNTGELTDGPHLHFELWSKGKPLDPETYLSF